jgi:hypothetical protein
MEHGNNILYYLCSWNMTLKVNSAVGDTKPTAKCWLLVIGFLRLYACDCLFGIGLERPKWYPISNLWHSTEKVYFSVEKVQFFYMIFKQFSVKYCKYDALINQITQKELQLNNALNNSSLTNKILLSLKLFNTYLHCLLQV